MTPRLPTPAVRAMLPMIRSAILRPQVPLALARRNADLLIGTVPRPRGTSATRGRLGGLPALRIDPAGGAFDPRAGVVLYLHGGGYIVGSARSHRPIATRLALGTELPVLALDYRLAPEHPFPAAVEDALLAWRALRAGGTPADRIVLAGDSAGGGLCLALAMRLRSLGQTPRCLALIAPWVDLGPDAQWRSESPGRDPLLNPHDIANFTQHYVGGHSTDPEASPVHGELAGLPPLIVHTGGDDPLRPDALRLIEKAKAAGVSVDHADFPGMWHVFHLLAGYLAAGDDALDALVESILRT